MNVDKNNDRKTVISKYFTNELVMDESLSDFKEKKDFTGPKKAQKIQKPRRVKRLKGQKDIRTVLKKKNELLSYSKEFDEICKQSGIDVDSEQLQLAVALSKSLEPEDKPGLEAETSQSSSCQERTGKIRTTLLEYGFKVPEIKIVNSKKRTKKHRKAYKLLLTSDTEKKQTISDKYSQVLFNCLDCKVQNFQTPNTESKLFNICTKIQYYDLKNDLLYVPDLVVHSPNSVGSLLRDWSDIPGRPISPELSEEPCISFTEIVCSQEELNIILSGSIKSAKDLFKKKNFEGAETIKDTMKLQINSLNHSKTLIDEDLIVVPECYKNNLVQIDREEEEETCLLTVTQQIRSSSPDIFGDDDEVSLINESRTDVKILKSNLNMDPSSNFVDLTNCAKPAQNDVKIENSQPSQLSQKCDVTKRKSNDFMEITDCAATLSQPIIVNKIDLTQDDSPVTDVKEKNDTVKEVDTFDLTQSSPDDLPEVLISGKEDTSADDTIILKDEQYNTVDMPLTEKDISKVEPCSVDLTDTFQLENVCDHKDIIQGFEEFNHDHSDDQEETDDMVNIIKNSNQDIELAQTNYCENATNSVCNKIQSTDLGKIDNVSIDYDDMFDEMVSNAKNNSIQSIVYDLSDEETDEKVGSKSDLVSNSSQNSQAFEISDNELNYSIQKSKCENNCDVGGFSVLNNVSLANFSKKSLISYSLNDESLPAVDVKGAAKPTSANVLSPIKVTTSKAITNKVSKAILVETPKNKDYIIKTENVTPIQDYASMSTPDRNLELDKYGLKPFKRKRGIQLLTHLYHQTHPIMESCQDHSPSKRLKHSPVKLPKSAKSSPRKQMQSPKKSPQKCVEVLTGSKDLFEVTKDQPHVKEIACDQEDWVFQKREKAKIHSCRVPLHIAFHNYVSCRQRLYEAILRYEPIDIDTVHKGLVANGFRYDPKDLLKYMDKRCITVKTADNVKNRKS